MNFFKKKNTSKKDEGIEDEMMQTFTANGMEYYIFKEHSLARKTDFWKCEWFINGEWIEDCWKKSNSTN